VARKTRTSFGFPLLAVALLLAVSTASAQTRPKLKIFLSVDMEGVAGVVTDQQLGPTGFEYQKAREYMTAEVLAAIEGARAAGATEILVVDSHGNAQNVLVDQLPADVQLVRAFPRPLGMMQGIDETFDAAVFIGYHASTVSPAGVRAHTFSSANLADVKLNGSSVSEGVFNAAVAGHFGVPVVAVSGDDAAVAEIRKAVAATEGAIVKWAYGFHSARTLTPKAAAAEIRGRVQAGLARRASIPPYRLALPVTVDVTFKNYRPSEILAYLPIVERLDAHTVRYRGRDMLEVSRFVAFLLNYQPDLSP
jgi:D-amino peptidase